VILAIGDTVRGIDFFDKASTLAAYWPGLVQGYAVDALHVQPADVTIADAEAFIAQVLTAEATTADAVGLGRDLVIADAAVAGNALEWDDAVVHLAAFASPTTTEQPRPARRINRSRWVE
jgi:nucleoside-diphosphate-sugar epimerase